MKGERKINGGKLNAKVLLTWDPTLQTEGGAGPVLHQETLWTALKKMKKKQSDFVRNEDTGDMKPICGARSRCEKAFPEDLR